MADFNTHNRVELMFDILVVICNYQLHKQNSNVTQSTLNANDTATDILHT